MRNFKGCQKANSRCTYELVYHFTNPKFNPQDSTKRYPKDTSIHSENIGRLVWFVWGCAVYEDSRLLFNRVDDPRETRPIQSSAPLVPKKKKKKSPNQSFLLQLRREIQVLYAVFMHRSYSLGNWLSPLLE